MSPAKHPTSAKRAERRRAAKRRALVAVAIGGSIVLVGLLFAFYFPTRSWLHQRHRAAQNQHQLAELQAANRDLQHKVDALKEPATVERLARGQYGLVRPGEKAYVVLPPSAGPTDLPRVWPFAGPGQPK